TILFDLPETAEISIQLFDLLGRQVMSRPPTTVQAGADRGVQIEGSSLSSGTYIYRVIARSATSTMIKSGRLTLVK
ncbi:MAG: T9SS type A sorting domain-containing protein, partial [Rhodothermales bacterium]